MSVAPQLAVGNTLAGTDNTSFSVFQNINSPGGTILTCGNIFFGLQGYCAVRIPLGAQLGLARGGKIETGLINAAVTFTAAGNWTVGGTISVNVMVDDSPRYGPLDSRLAWKPSAGFGPAWRKDNWGLFDTRIEDTGGTPFLDNGPGAGGTWGIRVVANQREQLAQQFIIPAGPSWSVARIILELRKHGAPTGSMEVAIQASQSDGYNHIQPDGVDIAVSAAVLNSTIPLTPATGSITYAFAPNVVLAPGTYWAVLRPLVSYPVSAVNFIVWMQDRVFLGTGSSHRTLLGTGFDIGNYPGQADVHLDTKDKEVGTPVIWNPIARTTGQTISTPNLSGLVQDVITRSGHETTSALCFTFRTAGETRLYRFAAHNHPTLAKPGFAAQYTRRNTRGEVT